ncbi:hypothetical protein [Thalassospira lucentensis]|uniref:hypothetical protein n=1 Tax=Thalassospira lucentensis TaxID=168935 RepID=UPI003AA907F1
MDEPSEKSSRFSGIFNEAKTRAGKASDKVRATAGKTANELKVAERINQVRTTVDTNTPEFVKSTAGKVGSSFDTVTGAKLLEEVRAMVVLQEKYNDVLATKLEEALQRIEILEATLSKGTQR